ncbi:hypothetical protein ACLOJK_038515 [Asimina triloba]
MRGVGMKKEGFFYKSKTPILAVQRPCIHWGFGWERIAVNGPVWDVRRPQILGTWYPNGSLFAEFEHLESVSLSHIAGILWNEEFEKLDDFVE